MIQKIFFETLPSTNTYAKEHIPDFSLPTLIIANEQTAGRGRRGNSFFSPKDTGLYMTLVFEETKSSELLTPTAAVAVCEELESIGTNPGIKWVNDIFIDEKKVCGILTERYIAHGKPYIILGIGINLLTKVFPDELSSAGSINLECDKNRLAIDISLRVLEYIDKNSDEEITEKYRSKLFIIEKNVSYFKNNIQYSGTVKGINNQCNLIISHSDGSEDILSSGEISIKI